jgi:antitoxin component of RelBE/YafQ-DinJ toxin-antitoxin module
MPERFTVVAKLLQLGSTTFIRIFLRQMEQKKTLSPPKITIPREVDQHTIEILPQTAEPNTA